MCGFNQSEWIFFIWIVLVSNQILVSFYGILIENSCPIGNKAPFWLLSFPITQKIHFCSGCRIQSEDPFKDLNLPNK